MTETRRETLLLVDDDPVFRDVLRRALQRRGLAVATADSVADGRVQLTKAHWTWAVIDLKLPDGSGLELIEALTRNGTTRILVLTGYASIATAVEAVKLGAVNYLPKPATTDEILDALGRIAADSGIPINSEPPSVDRLEWEHIQRVLQQHEGNVSATARALNMHRRTLQRKLAKRPVRR